MGVYNLNTCDSLGRYAQHEQSIIGRRRYASRPVVRRSMLDLFARWQARASTRLLCFSFELGFSQQKANFCSDG
jgi:hypothetical protein